MTETVNILNDKIDNISTTFSDLKIKNSKLELKNRYIINKLYEISKNQDSNNSEMKDDIIKLLQKIPKMNSIVDEDKPNNYDVLDSIIKTQDILWDEDEDEYEDII